MFGNEEICLDLIGKLSPLAASSMFVRYHTPAETKPKALTLFAYIHIELLNLIKNSNWIDQETKLKALKKAQAIRAYIGHDDRIFNNSFIDLQYNGVNFPGNF